MQPDDTVKEQAIADSFLPDYAGDFEAFRRENRCRVNRHLNRILWVCILVGPAIALGVMGGVFTQTSYTACLVVSLVMAAMAGGNLLILVKNPYSYIPGFIALAGMDILLCYMYVSHISIRLTWFLIPLLSLLFCDRKAYIGASIFNYAAMGIATWLASGYYAEVQLDYATPMASFFNTFAGCTIEALVMFAAGYALGKITGKYYRRMIGQYSEVQEQHARAQEQMDVLESMAAIYAYVNLINFNESTELSLYGEGLRKHVIKEGQDHTRLTTALRYRIAPDMVDSFWEFTDITTVPSRLINRNSIAGEFVDKSLGWFRAQYIKVKGEPGKEPDSVIFTMQNIDADKRREEHLIRISMTDELTNLYNRRCFEEDVSAIQAAGISESLVLISADVNGLKTVNDNMGHSAGDELIQGAAECLLTAIGSHGKAYRIGGDEFAAIVHVADCRKLVDRIREEVASWKGKVVNELSMSVGYASYAEYPDATLEELLKIGDKAMYEEKSRYYLETGRDRRRYS